MREGKSLEKSRLKIPKSYFRRVLDCFKKYFSKVRKYDWVYSYLMLGILILATGCMLYSECIFGDKILAYGDWGYDTKHSFLPAYESFVRVFSEHDIKFYDFSYGLGTTWSARMMLLFDPFVLLMAAVCTLYPKVSMGILLVYMQLLKSLVGGELCFAFLKQHRCSDKGAMLSAYIFSFCGYMIATGQHYIFASFLVLTMLILVAAERFIQKRKYFLLIFSSACIAAMGPYITFQAFLMIAVYVCIRIGMEEKTLFGKIRDIFQTGFFIVTGLLISMYSFLLQVYDILKVSARISELSFVEKIKDAFFWVPFAYLKTGILRFFSSNLEGTVNNWKGIDAHFEAMPFFFSVLFVLCAGQFVYILFVKKRKNKEQIILCGIFLLFCFALCNGFLPMLFNAFADLSYRYVFVWIPFFSLLLAYTLDQTFLKGNFSHLVNIIITAAGCLILFMMPVQGEKYVEISKNTAIVTLTISAVLLSLSKKKRLIKMIYPVLFAVVAGELLIDNAIVIYGERTLMTKETYAEAYWDRDMETLVDYVNDLEGDNFVRIDRTYIGYDTPDVMLSVLYPYRSVSIYNNIINAHLIEFANQLFPDIYYANQLSYNIRSYGVPFDEIIASNLGIKYLITDSERKINGWKLIKTSNNRYLYQNESLQSAGLIYQNAVSQTEFEQLSLLDKKTMMSQVIVLDDEDTEPDMQHIPDTYCEEKEKALVQICDQNGDEIFLDEEKGIDIRAGSYKNVLEFRLDSELINIAGKQSFLYFKIMSDGVGSLNVIYNNGMADILSDNISSNLKVPSEGQIKEIAIPLMQDTVSVKIECFDSNIRLDCIQVISSAPASFSNSQVSFENKDMGNIVRGTVVLNEKAYLMMPIVFERGWHIYVDGKEEEILKANFGFSAVVLESGKHEIVFEYKSPLLIIGIGISCVGWMIVCCLLVFHIYQKLILRNMRI